MRYQSAAQLPLRKSDTRQTITVTLALRRRPDHAPIPTMQSYVGCPPRPKLTSDEFAELYGADPDDIEALKIHYRHFTVQHHAARRHVYLTGTIGNFNQSFGIELQDYRKRHGKQMIAFRGHPTPAQIPDHLKHVIVDIHDLETEPQVMPPPPITGNPPVISALTPTMLRTMYNFPSHDAAGQVIGIPVFQGWGNYTENDLTLTCNHWSITKPTVTNIVVDSFTDNTIGGENALDVSMVAMLAPGCQIVNYKVNSFNHFMTRVLHPLTGEPQCTIVSISATQQDTAGAEALWMLFEDAAIMGITCVAAVGDWGITDAAQNEIAIYPASDPYVTGVGGTTIGANSGTVSATNFVEWLWNQNKYYSVTGGGISFNFPVPSYQASFNTTTSINKHNNATFTGRGSPDLAAVANADSNVPYFVNGFLDGGNGTSAACPMVAANLACISDGFGSNVGFVNPSLYAKGNDSTVIRHMSSGGPTDNAFTDASVSPSVAFPGYPLNNTTWSANVGLGVLNGNNFLQYLINNKSTGTIKSISLTFNVPHNPVAGTTVGSATVTMTSGTFTGSLMIVTPAAILYALQFIGTNLVVFDTGLTIADGSYDCTVTATQEGLTPLSLATTILVPTNVSLTDITLAPTTIDTANSGAGVIVGALTVQSQGNFTGTLTTSSSDFAITNSHLTCSAVLSSGSYSVPVTATMTGASGSPFSKTFTVVVTSTATSNTFLVSP